MKRVFLSLNLAVFCAISSIGANSQANDELPTGVALAKQADLWLDYNPSFPRDYEVLMNFCRANVGEVEGEVLRGCYPNAGKIINSAITNVLYYAVKLRCNAVVQYLCIRPEDYFSTNTPTKSKAPSAPRYQGLVN